MALASTLLNKDPRGVSFPVEQPGVNFGAFMFVARCGSFTGDISGRFPTKMSSLVL